MIVYVVKSITGDKSTVIAVLTDKDTAFRIAAMEKAATDKPDYVQVDPWDTDEYVQKLQDGLKPYEVRFSNGKVAIERASLVSFIENLHFDMFEDWQSCSVWAFNEEEALQKAYCIVNSN